MNNSHNHERTEADVRALLAKRERDCADRKPTHKKACPGWAIMTPGDGIPGIEVCDDCAHALKEAHGIDIGDDDVARLPEARAALQHERLDDDDEDNV